MGMWNRESVQLKIVRRLIIGLCLLATPALAEYARYEQITLTGLARESWSLNPEGLHFAMVCNVNGPDGFLSVRAGPGTDHKVNRRLKRLAIVEVDTRARQGNWVQVVTAFRTFTPKGKPLQANKDLHVTGWAHDSYLCDFID